LSILSEIPGIQTLEAIALVATVAVAGYMGWEINGDRLTAKFDTEKLAQAAALMRANDRIDTANGKATDADAQVLRLQSTMAAQAAKDSAALAASLDRLHIRVSGIAADISNGPTAISVSACTAAVSRLADGVNRLAGAGGLLATAVDSCNAQRTACESWAGIVQAQVKGASGR
jgi:membrane-associated protease RseP (regulator of RpoE activity)